MIICGMHNHCLTYKAMLHFLSRFGRPFAFVISQISFDADSTPACCDAEYIPVCLSALQQHMDWSNQAFDLLRIVKPHMMSSGWCLFNSLHGFKLIGDLLLPQTQAGYQERLQN